MSESTTEGSDMDGVTTVTDRGVPPEPTTEAAWDALVNDIVKTFDWPRDRVVFALSGHRPAIEAEARASQPLTLDVERLAKAMRWAGIRCEPDFATIEEAARQLASDYASTLLDPE